MQNIAIIGAGIAGLTFALALKKLHIPFTIYESAESFKIIGAGIAIANNAMQVFRILGIDNLVASKGHSISHMRIVDNQFRTLSNMPLKKFEDLYNLKNIAILRSDLHQILVEAVGIENIVLNKRLKNIFERGNGFVLEFEDETVIESKFIIGADGLKSKVRNTLFGAGKIRHANQICWRGILDYNIPEIYNHIALEAWGKGKRFGLVQMNEKSAYWYFLINNNLGTSSDNLLDLAKDFYPLAKEIIAATADEHIIINDILDLKPINKWSTEKVCLIGDAAHATTPNLGQGACQGIEDAYVLMELLKKHDISKAFALYPSIRKNKAHAIVNKSWHLGKIAQWENNLLISIRNNTMKIMPESLNLQILNSLFKLDKVK